MLCVFVSPVTNCQRFVVVIEWSDPPTSVNIFVKCRDAPIPIPALGIGTNTWVDYSKIWADTTTPIPVVNVCI